MKKSRFYDVIGWVALALSIFTNTPLSIAIIVAFCLVMIYSLNVGDDDITEDMVSAAMNMSEEEMEEKCEFMFMCAMSFTMFVVFIYKFFTLL